MNHLLDIVVVIAFVFVFAMIVSPTLRDNINAIIKKLKGKL
jgi:hypothetical protein